MIKIFKATLILASVAFFIYGGLINWVKISEHKWNVDIILLAVSTVMATFVFYLNAFGWSFILRAMSLKVPYVFSVKIWIYASFYRYIPGVVWAYLSRAEMIKPFGVDRASCIKSMVAEMLFLLLGALLVCVPYYAYIIELMSDFGFFLILLIPIFVIIYFFREKITTIFFRLLNHRPMFFSAIKYKYKNLFLLLFYYAVLWVFFALAFYLLCSSLGFTSGNNTYRAILIGLAFPLSFVVGVMAVVSPGGIGVREVALCLLLSSFLPASQAYLLAIASRLWVMSAEVCAVFITLVLSKLFLYFKSRSH